MKIKVDNFLTAEQLGEAGKNTSVCATVKEVRFVEANDLPFESKKGRYDLVLEVNGEETTWLANKTSLRALNSVFGNDAENWVGKSINLWTMEQLVQGKIKRVIYADASLA